MMLLEPNPDIEEEKDLTLFVQKYLEADNPGTTGDSYCRDGKRRSFSDLMELYLNYNPETQITLDDVIKCLVDVKLTINYSAIHLRFCKTPHKVVIFKETYSSDHSSWRPIFNNKIKNWIEYYHEIGVDGLTEKYVSELLLETYKNKQNADK